MWVRSPPPAPSDMRIVALDYGEKRVGMAVGDTGLRIAFPQSPLPNKFDLIVKAIMEQGAEKVIVGIPIGLGGKVGRSSKKVVRFVSDLSARLNIPVEMVDERLTTKEAQRRLSEAGASIEKKKAAVDSMAAALILEVYFGL